MDAPESAPEDQPLKPTKPQERQTFKQLKLSDRELQRLRSRIEEDFLAAKSNHQARILKFRRIWRMWRSLMETDGTRQEGPDFQFPMLKWITFGQWARMMQALLGDDAEISAIPTSPTGESDATKVGHYMTWRFFQYMDATVGLATFVFRALLFGRGHAEIIYEQEYYWERKPVEEVHTEELDAAGLDWIDNKDGTMDVEVLAYDGPRMRPLWPSQLILPAQDNCVTTSDFEWKIRRDRTTPQSLLEGQRRGKYQGIKENWKEIQAHANQRQERDPWYDEELLDVDEAEGVDHSTAIGNRNSLEVWRWYGKWRLPKGKQDAALDNLDRRRDFESELLVTYLPDCQRIIGVEDLRDHYPRMQKRDPFVDLGTVKDGSYWGPGLGELCEDLQNEATINHALFRKAGMLTVGPIIFFKPSSGFDPDTFEYKPGMAIPSEDPDGVKAIELRANLQFTQEMQQTLKAVAELVTGVSDQTLGRVSDRPNAPQTASGQAMLIQEGNTRVSLDMSMIRADLAPIIGYVWELDREYADEEVFFRVTDEDAGALFDVDKGFGKMTSEEREHPFGFNLKFATSIWSREAKKQNLLQIYQLSMSNPIVATNPRALWVLLNRLWEAFGEKNFRQVIPEPPEMDTPKTPKDEWLLSLKGEDIQVNPLDDDDQHLIDHRRRLENAVTDLPERRDTAMEDQMSQHIVAHEQQKRQKMILQQLATAAMAKIQQMQAQGLLPQAGPAPGAAPGGPPNGAPQPPQVASPQPPGPQGPVSPAEQMLPKQ